MKNVLVATTLASALLLTGCSDDPNDVNFPPGGNAGGGNPVVQPPLAVNDSYTVLGRGQLNATAANGVLANDTPNGGVVVFAQSATTLGGNVTVNGDGSFTYNAPTLAAGNDTFTYRVQNAVGSSTATVTIGILGSGFFVNNQAAAGGNGSQAQPFQTLAQAQAASNGVNGAQIVVFRGDGTTTGYNTGFSLGGNQTLRGFDPANRPNLVGQISFSDGNLLQDVNLVGSPGNAIGAVNARNGTVRNVTIANSSFTAVALNNATGTFTLNGLNVTNSGRSGVDATSPVGGNLTWSLTNSTFTNTTQGSVVLANVSGTANHTVTVNGNTFTNGRSSELGGLASGNGTVFATITNNTLIGGGTGLIGIEMSSQGGANVTGIVTGNNITGFTGQGIFITAFANSTSRYRFENNRTLGNQANLGFQAVSAINATLGAILNANTSDRFSLTQGNTATFSVEQFATFTARNVGNLTTAGTIQDAPAGSLGIP